MPNVTDLAVPDDIFERLRNRAEIEQRSIGDELLSLVSQVLQCKDRPTLRLSEPTLSQDLPAPFDLPRSSCPKQVAAYAGEPRRPDEVFLQHE